MNIPCPTKISGSDCECFEDSPIRNISAEAPDVPAFLSMGFGRVNPPLGVDWQENGCLSTCQSTVSQEAADLCAAAQAFECAISTWTKPTPPPTTPVPVPFFLNSGQAATVFCPDGSPFTFTVPPGIFAALSQAAADAEAFSYAKGQAFQRLLCLGSLTSPVCVDAATTLTITATGRNLAQVGQLDLFGDPVFNTWTLIGTLPPGLSFNGGELQGNSMTITGTPTKPGTYTFMVMVTDAAGGQMTKSYTLVVAGITNTPPAGMVGVSYAFTLTTVGFSTAIFSLASGSLPGGLSLDATGDITGTPTTTGTAVATIQMTDVVSGFSCQETVVISVISPPGIDWDELVWGNEVARDSSGNNQWSNTPGTYNGNVASLNGTYGPACHGSTSNIGTLTYTGPSTMCNMHVVATMTGFPAEAHFSVWEGPSTYGTLLAVGNINNTSGTLDVPFTVPLSVAQLYSVQVNVNSDTVDFGGGPGTVSATFTLTPFS